MAREISGEWAVEVARHGVDPRELEERWEVSEGLHDSCEALLDAADRLRGALCSGIEAWGDERESVAVASAEFDQALAEFRDSISECRPYVGGV